MTQIAAITINDGAATPVAHTFNPISSGMKAAYREAVGGIAAVGQGRLTILSSYTDKTAGMNRVRVKLELPVLEIAAEAGSYNGYIAGPAVAYTMTGTAEFILPNRSSEQNRKDLRVLMANALLNAQVVDAVDKIQAPY